MILRAVEAVGDTNDWDSATDISTEFPRLIPPFRLIPPLLNPDLEQGGN